MILLVHLITTVFRLACPGGLRSVVAESVLIKHQLLIANRSRRRAPLLCAFRSADRRILFDVDTTDSPSAGCHRIKTINPAALPSRTGPAKSIGSCFRQSADMKQRNPTWRCSRIVEQTAYSFRRTVPINKDVVLPNSDSALPTSAEWRWSVLAHLLGSYQWTQSFGRLPFVFALNLCCQFRCVAGQLDVTNTRKKAAFQRAIACNGRWHLWQVWQRWQCGFCNLRRDKGTLGFESPLSAPCPYFSGIWRLFRPSIPQNIHQS
jgi:hypothetical protein